MIEIQSRASLKYAPGKKGEIVLEIADDHGIKDAKILLRIEGETAYQTVSLKRKTGAQTVGVLPNFHQNRTVEFYVEVVDHSGHVGRLGSPAAPMKLKKKGR